VTERELRALAAYLDFPPERDLAPAVRARLTARPQRRRTLVLVLAAALLAIAVAFAVPPARSAILRFFHLQGVTIEVVDELPQVKTGPLELGRPISLAAARRTAGFRPLTSDLLGDPDRVTWDGRQLWLRYGETRLLVSEFRDGEVSVFIKKVAGPGTTITPVVVNGSQGYFISGAEHFVYQQPNELIREERVRLARDVILFEAGPLTVRIEGDLTRAQGLRIARSFR
jgi:hypothetical protein